ncbi:MAG TPA: redoxin domain-containing protein [Fulvivirga sp.]|nr:redoxin domain-containing protein [Fulvivirga sp.]
MKIFISSLIVLLVSSSLHSQNIADFTLTDAKSKSEVSLNNFNNKKGVAVIFTSNVCPYSVYYEGRITQLVADYPDDIQFLLVNSFTDDKETVDQMRSKIVAWGINAPYLADKDGGVKKAFGARKSPEVFLLKNNGGKFSIFYKGAIDNNPQVATDVKERYLKNNIENLLNGRSATNLGTRPIGCMIK